MSERIFPNPDYPFSEPGLTKRELFAAMAMQGLLSGCADLSCTADAAIAVEWADALITALKTK